MEGLRIDPAKPGWWFRTGSLVVSIQTKDGSICLTWTRLEDFDWDAKPHYRFVWRREPQICN